MKATSLFIPGIVLLFTLFSTLSAHGQEIEDYYALHKNDNGMESGIVPPKLASLFVDEDYPDAIDVLKSLHSLKYLNYWGKGNEIHRYSSDAQHYKGSFDLLLQTTDKGRLVNIYGTEKKGTIRKVMVVVETSSQFILLIGKGKLSHSQLNKLPELSKEIQ